MFRLRFAPLRHDSMIGILCFDAPFYKQMNKIEKNFIGIKKFLSLDYFYALKPLSRNSSIVQPSGIELDAKKSSAHPPKKKMGHNNTLAKNVFFMIFPPYLKLVYPYPSC